MHDDDRSPELSPPPSTPALVRRAAPLVVAAMLSTGCVVGEEPGAPFDGGPGVPDAGITPAFDAGLEDAGLRDGGPPDAGPQPDDAGPVYDSGITLPDDGGDSGE